MKILAVHSGLNEDHSKRAATDLWRILRPLNELAKHEPTWHIDHQSTFIKGIDKYASKDEFTEEEMEKAFEVICGYDIVFASYHADPTAYTMLKVAADKAGVQFIMDVDDDMFSINPDNPVWQKINDEQCYWMQCMIRDNAWISTTTYELADVFRKRRELPDDTVFVNPNFINDEYQHFSFNNDPNIVIGYFGSSSHHADLHNTGVLEAVARIMHENKSVRFKAVGMPVDTYLPKGRYQFLEGKRGDGWLKQIYPNLKMDISIAPLEDNIFNYGKSNIKWQESTRAGAVFVASREGPYKGLSNDVAVLAENTTNDWYTALKRVVDDAALRSKIVSQAKIELRDNWRLENHWMVYRDMFKRVKEYKDANH